MVPDKNNLFFSSLYWVVSNKTSSVVHHFAVARSRVFTLVAFLSPRKIMEITLIKLSLLVHRANPKPYSHLLFWFTEGSSDKTPPESYVHSNLSTLAETA